ncbi:GNAT family N-acetyltransferase [Clostridium sp. C2-6-12]|uniref:GNAT family N-acetyltransferase n=1 Tax=Clostridium sp. C2-6-12 TaxID=2698832 RepID=UPI0013697D32|nr:GNAT family N-acetyltransferase [Clostridium sp. C2-6-12]
MIIASIYYTICLFFQFIKKTATLSIALTEDIYKGKGYGTAVEKSMLNYGIYRLNFQTIYADTVLRNTCSEHVPKKIGFEYQINNIH